MSRFREGGQITFQCSRNTTCLLSASESQVFVSQSGRSSSGSSSANSNQRRG